MDVGCIMLEEINLAITSPHNFLFELNYIHGTRAKFLQLQCEVTEWLNHQFNPASFRCRYFSSRSNPTFCVVYSGSQGVPSPDPINVAPVRMSDKLYVTFRENPCVGRRRTWSDQSGASGWRAHWNVMVGIRRPIQGYHCKTWKNRAFSALFRPWLRNESLKVNET